MSLYTNFYTPDGASVQIALGDYQSNATLIKCTAANLPSAIAGFAIGCIAMATDTGILYSNTGTAASCTFTAVNSASALTLPSAFTDAATTTGASFQITANNITSGKAINLVLGGLTSGNGVLATASTANFTTGGALFKGDMVAATAGNGLVIVTTGAYTGTGLATLTAGAMTTGIALSIVSTTGLTSGSLIRATSSTAGAIATNGAIAFAATGNFTSSTVGFLDVSSTASTAGILARFSAVNTTAGDAVRITSNAITLGSATALNVSHTTSVLGAGSSLVRISSTGVDTGTTTGVLLDLSTTAAVGSTQIQLLDSSADTAARIGILSSISNVAAVLAVPFKSSNVAVVNTKFTKHIVLTDGSKTTTIWLSTDATTPNGTLSGTAGDICLNGPSSRMFYCTGTTNWTASNA